MEDNLKLLYCGFETSPSLACGYKFLMSSQLPFTYTLVWPPYFAIQTVDALVNRYMGSAFCSWYSTGGTVPGLLNQLSQEDLNLTNSAGGSGNMFEKFSTLDLDQAGAGGEYTPQKGTLRVEAEREARFVAKETNISKPGHAPYRFRLDQRCRRRMGTRLWRQARHSRLPCHPSGSFQEW